MKVNDVSFSASGICLGRGRESMSSNESRVDVVEDVGPNLTDVLMITSK